MGLRDLVVGHIGISRPITTVHVAPAKLEDLQRRSLRRLVGKG